MSVKLVNINQFLADQQHTQMRAKLVQQANQAKWDIFFEGVPCVQEIKDFGEEVSRAMPKVKFVPLDTEYVTVPMIDANGVYQTTNSIRLFNEFAVYLDEYPLDIGRISYKDHGARKKDNKTYGVYSRKIINAKYAVHRDQHHMVTASDIVKGAKNVSKYLIPFSTKELAQAFYDPMKSSVEASGGALNRELRSKADPIVHDHLEILKEICSLKKRGVEFTSLKFRGIAENIEDLIKRYDDEMNRNVGATFVRFYEVSGQTFFSTQQVIEIKKNHHQLQGTEEGKIEGKPVAEIPEDIMGAVSVLSILNNQQYVANVGMKVDDKHFWIERG